MILKNKIIHIKQMLKNKIDCVWHTYKSGEYVPRDLIKLAKEQGAEFIEGSDVEDADKPKSKQKKSKKSKIDERIEDIRADLEDDGKLNYSNNDKKKSPGRKKKSKKKVD